MVDKTTEYNQDWYKKTVNESPFPKTITEKELEQFTQNREDARSLTQSDKGEMYRFPT